MIRIVLAVLLVANAALLLLGLQARGDRPDPEAFAAGPGTARIRVSRDAPAAGAPAAERATPVCVDLGPLSPEEAARVEQSLAALVPGGRPVSQPVDVTAGWWVHVPPRRSRETAERDAARMHAQGVRDTFVVLEPPEWRHAISLGIFRSEEAARRFAEALRERGVTEAVAGPRQQTVRMVRLVAPLPTGAGAGRLLDLVRPYAGVEVRLSACPAPG